MNDLEKKHGFTYIDSLEFSDESLLLKVKKRCEKKLQKKAHASYNNWSRSLFEWDLKQKKAIAFAIEKVHPLVGYGVIASQTISAFSYVGEYCGEVRKRRWRDSRNDYVFGYVIGPHDTPWVIDASKKGNFTRFFNHSYTPNLISRWIITGGVAHIGFFSTCLIERGEEMTFDYGPYYWRNRPAPQERSLATKGSFRYA